MSDEALPDVAMLRAVEILAGLALHNREARLTPPPPIDRPVIVANERHPLHVGVTQRSEVERAFGRGTHYPAAGWWTYALSFADSTRLLSVIFYNDVLSGVEVYVPNVQSIPAMETHRWGDFRLEPGDVGLGAALANLDARYTPAVGGPSPIIYAQAFEIRFARGLGYVMGNAGIAQRLVVYAAP